MRKENSLEPTHRAEESTISPKPGSKFDPYVASLQNEEEEVKLRSEREDQESFASICSQLRALMKEILKLKTDKPEQWLNEVEDRKVKGLMLMLALRKLSRIQKVRVKDSREKSAEFRQGVDAITLQLQNLLYEVSHLKKEVRKCLEFQSADTEIDLVPINQFYKEAPENISRPKETVEDAHQQRLAQLHWELEQRRGQTQLSDKLKQEKEKVASIIDKQEEKLASLVPRINAILEATQPLQDSLNLPFNAKREQQKTSYLLPAPLYTLWVQATAYGEACDPTIDVQIVGDLESARKLIAPEDDTRTEASDSEGELDLQEENVQRKSRVRNERKNQEVDDTEDASLLNLHPLHIVLTIKTKDNNTIIIKFYYAQSLRIVTTKCSLDLVESSKPLLVDILNSDNLLNLLFPDDTGIVSPNPANEYQFQRLKLVTCLMPDHLNLIGKPYKWAQTLAGLSFLRCEPPSAGEALEIAQAAVGSQEESKKEDLDESSTLEENNEAYKKALGYVKNLKAVNNIAECSVKIMANFANVITHSKLRDYLLQAVEFMLRKNSPQVSSSSNHCSETLSWKMSAEHMHHTIAAIKRRLQARLALYAQFQVLESATSTSAIPLSPEVLQQLFPGKVSSELCSWKPITWSDYEESPTTQHILECGAVNSHSLPFKAIFTRQAVTMEAFVAISPDYPNIAPVFALKLIWSKEETAAKSPHIRQMESELNTHYNELVSTRTERLQLLPLQLYRLAMCLDILTEAASTQGLDVNSSASQMHFHKEKIFFRAARGPDRALPLKYLPKLGVFAQR